MRDGAVSHFIPDERNGYVPHVLRHRVLLAYSVILILLKAVLVVGYAVLPASSVLSSAVTAENVIRLTNVARSAAGLEELRPNALLSVAAERKAEDMVEKQYFAHTSPEGLTPWHWIREAGYDYRSAGENLAVHYFSSEGVHEGWMASPTHRQNILDERYVDIGVGVVQGRYDDYDTIMVVEMFGRPVGYQAAIAVTDGPESGAGGSTEDPSVADTAIVAEQAPIPPEEVGIPVAADADVTASASEGPSAPPVPEETPSVVESSVAVVPRSGGYEISVDIAGARSADAYLGPEAIELTQGDDGSFDGFLPVDEESAQPQHLYVAASGAEGQRSVQSVAMLAPNGTTQDLFVSGGVPGRAVKFLGIFEVRDLEDGVKRFYVLTIVFLLLALALKIIVKFHIQRHSVIVHTLFVVGLAAFLLLL